MKKRMFPFIVLILFSIVPISPVNADTFQQGHMDESIDYGIGCTYSNIDGGTYMEYYVKGAVQQQSFFNGDSDPIPPQRDKNCTSSVQTWNTVEKNYDVKKIVGITLGAAASVTAGYEVGTEAVSKCSLSGTVTVNANATVSGEVVTSIKWPSRSVTENPWKKYTVVVRGPKKNGEWYIMGHWEWSVQAQDWSFPFHLTSVIQGQTSSVKTSATGNNQWITVPSNSGLYEYDTTKEECPNNPNEA